MKKFASSYVEKYKNFIKTPKIMFFYRGVFYISFLLLFSYMILCDLSYFELIQNNGNKKSSSFEEHQTKVIKNPSVVEWLILFYILCTLIEEIYQFSVSNTEGKFSYKLFRCLKFIKKQFN